MVLITWHSHPVATVRSCMTADAVSMHVYGQWPFILALPPVPNQEKSDGRDSFPICVRISVTASKGFADNSRPFLVNGLSLRSQMSGLGLNKGPPTAYIYR